MSRDREYNFLHIKVSLPSGPKFQNFFTHMCASVQLLNGLIFFPHSLDETHCRWLFKLEEDTALVHHWSMAGWRGVVLDTVNLNIRVLRVFFFLLQILAALVPKLCKSYILLSELQTVFGDLILLITENGSSRIPMDQDVRDLCITLGKLSCFKPVAEVLRKVYPRVSRKARYTEFILDCPQIWRG